MEPTRQQKNLVLVIANFALVPIVWWKLAVMPAAVGPGLSLWAIAAPLVGVAVLVTPLHVRLAKPFHIALFLCTGAAIGLTLGSVMRDAEAVWWGEIAWLPAGIAAAVFHYWPSGEDVYSNGGS